MNNFFKTVHKASIMSNFIQQMINENGTDIDKIQTKRNKFVDATLDGIVQNIASSFSNTIERK